MGVKIIGGFLNEYEILVIKKDKLILSHRSKLYEIASSSIQSVQKNEEVKKVIFATLTFTNNIGVQIKCNQKEFEELYQLQFVQPKTDFQIHEKKKTLIWIIGIIVFFVLSLTLCSTESSTTNTTSNRPQQCDYLKEYNLQANDWRQQEGDNYVCISDIISTDGSDDIDANGLDYQVEGTQNGVSLMTVRVLLNRSQQATEAKTKFIEIAKELIKKQTGTEAPKSVISAIKKNKNYQTSINGSKVTIEIAKKTQYHPKAGYGFNIKLSIENDPNKEQKTDTNTVSAAAKKQTQKVELSGEFPTLDSCLTALGKETTGKLKVIRDKPDVVSGFVNGDSNYVFVCEKQESGTKGTYYSGLIEVDR